MISKGLTPKNSEIALKALDLGAIDVLCKPGEAYSAKDVSQAVSGAAGVSAAAEADSGAAAG